MKINKKKYFIALIVLVIVIISFIYLNKESSIEEETFDATKISSLNKFVFNLPDMDKQMCETFPNIILSTIEELKGVVDASFEYEGHIVTVYYSPEIISKENIINNEIYSWIGTEFISEESVDFLIAESLYQNRENNNNLQMPEKHMLNINEIEDLESINSQDFPSLVSAQWLTKNKDNVEIIEIGSVKEYEKGHLENSMNIEIEDIRTTTNSVTKQVLEKEKFETLMGNNEINNNDRIVIYSSKSLTHASRLYWTFKYYGHENVALVDGGKDKIREVFNLTEETIMKNISNYKAIANEKIMVDSNYILNQSNNSEIILLDVRNNLEFNSGHIANAINIDWKTLLNNDGTLKKKEELEEIFKGIDKNKEIIIYCVSGTRASYAWFVLSEVLNYENVKLFDGSIIEWNYKQLPLEK